MDGPSNFLPTQTEGHGFTFSETKMCTNDSNPRIVMLPL
uniref:Uncharacterized protein n=1 Tax=Rhizophora mucronata TaxID=61149 RepID=A0A2P2MX31_RHIMU